MVAASSTRLSLRTEKKGLKVLEINVWLGGVDLRLLE